MTQRFEAFIGLCVVLLAAIFFFMLTKFSNPTGSGHYYPVKAYFSNISGIDLGADIKMSGVKIGTVASSELDPNSYRAVLTLSILDTIKLPTDSVVKISSDGLLGGAFLTIEPGAEENFIEENGQITYTQDAVSILDLLSRAVFSAGVSE